MKSIVIALIALSCTLQLNARQYKPYADSLVDELRLELSDLKHELKSALVDLNLLDERVRKQEQPKSPVTPKNDASQISGLERRLNHLEKMIEKAVADLRTLHAHTTQAMQKLQELEADVAAQEQKLDEVNKLKGTLASISKAIGASPSDEKGATYRVKAGDSLEKIARNHKISVDSLKKLNKLQNDKIIIGQELKITHDAS